MTRMRSRLVVAVGTVAVTGASLAGGPTPTPTAKPVFHRPTGIVVQYNPHLEPRWGPTPTNSADTSGCATHWTGKWWVFDWGVKNTGTVQSQPSQLTLTCTVAGGKQWPAGQAAYLRDRLCTCNTRVYYVPYIPAGQTIGFDPNGLRFQSFQGTDYVPCSDPNYPHAVVTAKVGTATVTVPLCK